MTRTGVMLAATAPGAGEPDWLARTFLTCAEVDLMLAAYEARYDVSLPPAPLGKPAEAPCA